MFDALLLSRIQFGFVISFHIVFPAFSIGLAWWLVFIEARWLRVSSAQGAASRDAQFWRDLYFFWLKIFAVSFGMGVVSGIVMSFQFGSNWARYSELAGNIVGPLLNYEVLTAFFLEATFLGVMLFGANRVSARRHFFATCTVAVGTLISSFWIIAANSWMQTPAGYELRNGVFFPVDWWAIIFNPSFPYRLVHMVLAAFITTAFVIGGVSAIYLLRELHREHARVMLKHALAFVAIAVPIQIFVGDLSGLMVREHQPAKLAAIEARWETERGVPLALFAWPDETNEKNDFQIEVPHLGSLILTHEWNGEIKGLKDFPPQDRPPVKAPFFAFRVMAGLGFLMLALALSGLVLWRRGHLCETRWYLAVWAAMLPSGFIALLTGWYVAEIGRQPYVVYGVLRTADAVSPIAAGSVLVSLFTFIFVYLLLFGFAIWYLVKLFRRGPIGIAPPPADATHTPARPLSAADAKVDI